MDGKWVRLFLIVLVVLIALIIIAGIGYYRGQPSVQAPAYSNATTTSEPDTLIVTRAVDSQDNLPAFAKTITDTSTVQSLYAEILTLPLPPSSPTNCPIQNFVEYDLSFDSAGQLVLQANYNPTGCRILMLSNGQSRWAGQNDIFNTNLEQTLGLSDQEFSGL